MMINTKLITLLTALCYCLSFSAYSESELKATPVRKETTLQILLRISGISATPQQMRGEEKGQAGQIWIVNTETNKQFQVANSINYHSPVFLPKDTGLLALKQNEIIEISLTEDIQRPLFLIPGIVKIIGFDQSDNNRFLILLEDNQLEMVSIKTGARERLDYPPGTETEIFLSHIKSWNRVYGDSRVFVKTQRKRTILGQRSFSNVYYQHNKQEFDLSRCKKSSCSQPSLSYDGTRVAFIKSD